MLSTNCKISGADCVQELTLKNSPGVDRGQETGADFLISAPSLDCRFCLAIAFLNPGSGDRNILIFLTVMGNGRHIMTLHRSLEKQPGLRMLLLGQQFYAHLAHQG